MLNGETTLNHFGISNRIKNKKNYIVVFKIYHPLVILIVYFSSYS
jgi:hypothetical protein